MFKVEEWFVFIDDLDLSDHKIHKAEGWKESTPVGGSSHEKTLQQLRNGFIKHVETILVREKIRPFWRIQVVVLQYVNPPIQPRLHAPCNMAAELFWELFFFVLGCFIFFLVGFGVCKSFFQFQLFPMFFLR